MIDKEDTYPRPGGSHSGTTHGYEIHARLNSHSPEPLGNQLFDSRWRKIHFSKGFGIGVPTADKLDYKHLDRHGLYGYAAAQALRWWFHANADASGMGRGMGLETKLVQFEVKFETSCEAISEHCPIGGEDRSSLFPDWGKEREKKNAGQ